MVPDREADLAVSEQWLAVLNAVSEACAADSAGSASTRRVSARIRGGNTRSARALLRVLRRRGYVRTAVGAEDGAPVLWALTAAGREVRKHSRD